jgi:AAHS family 3-hydroxyphenylpropionic acid transporter
MTTVPGTVAAPPRPASNVVLIVAFCFVAAMCEGLDVQAAGIAAGGIKHDLAPTPGQLGLFFAAANFGLLFGAVFGGRLSDRVGRKLVLTASIGVFGVCSILTALAWDMTSLTAARLLTGLGLGGAMPNLIAMVADASHVKSRNAVIALTYVGMPLGGAVASVVVLGLPPGHWRGLFLIGGVAPLLIAPLMAFLLPNPRPARTAAAEGEPVGKPGRIAEVFAGGRLARTLTLWLGFFVAALTLHLLLSWLPLLLQGRGLSKNDAAIAQFAFNAGGAAAALVAGLGLDTRWRPASIVFSVAAIPVALLLVANAPAEVAGMSAFALLLGGGILAAQVILYSVAGGLYPPSLRGTGIGAAIGVGRLGSLAGPTLAALLLSAGQTSTQVLTSLLPVVLACGLAVAWLGWPRGVRGASGD